MKSSFGVALPDGDTHFSAMMELAGAGVYQLDKLEAAVALCKRRGLAVDVGAHVGFWTRELALLFEKVVAFEPVPANVECFLQNTDHLTNVTLYAYGLGALDSTVRIKADKKNSGKAHIADEGEKIKIYRLDRLTLPGRVDFLKIDVEGYESFVLRGARETIERDQPVVIVEQKPDNSKRYRVDTLEGVKLLESWGYEIAWTKSGDYCLTHA